MSEDGCVLAEPVAWETLIPALCYAVQTAAGMAHTRCFVKSGSGIVVGRAGRFLEIGVAAGTPDTRCRQEQCIFRKSDPPRARDLIAVGEGIVGLVAGSVVGCLPCYDRAFQRRYATVRITVDRGLLFARERCLLGSSLDEGITTSQLNTGLDEAHGDLLVRR